MRPLKDQTAIREHPNWLAKKFLKLTLDIAGFEIKAKF